MFPYDDDDAAACFITTYFPSSDIFIGLVLLWKGHDADDWPNAVFNGLG